jgi:DNA-binding MarR family transcriptional regulator
VKEPQTDSSPDGERSCSTTGPGIVDELLLLSDFTQRVQGRAAARHGLTVAQARLLCILADREPAMTQLARLLNVDRSSATSLVDRAQRGGLVLRQTIPEDRRGVYVTLTVQGRRLGEEFAADVEKQLKAFIERLSIAGHQRISLLARQVMLNGTNVGAGQGKT